MADADPQEKPQPEPTQEETENPEELESQEPKEEPAEPAEEQSEEDAEKPEGEEAETKPGDAEGEEKKAGEPEAEEKRKRAGGWQRKIERLERLNEQLVQRLTTQQPGAQPAPAKDEKDKTPEEKGIDYINSVVEQRLSARETQQKQQAALADFQRRTAEVRRAHPDLDDALASVSHILVPQELKETLLTSEHGAEIMYQLASNPDELARISALPSLAAAREVGRLEAKLSSVAPPAKPNGTAKRPAAPPTSVRGSTSNTRSLDDLPLSEYKRAYRSGRR